MSIKPDNASDDQPEIENTTIDSYDDFLKSALKAYWDGDRDRLNFISLLLASSEAWKVAWDGVRRPGTGKKVLTGAAGAAAVVMLARTFLGGPIGIILTGASIFSLGTLYARNHQRIWAQRNRYELLISEYRAKHTQITAKYVDGVVEAEERDLMLDGLLRRFLDELDQAPELPNDKAGSDEANSKDGSDAEGEALDSDD